MTRGAGVKRSSRDTPMMRQYLGIKARHPDAFLFYRMGDFYELFFEDALRAAPILNIALTTRDRDKRDPVPMCGVPASNLEGYLARLTDAGHRVAICEQVSQPGGRGLVRREVVEVVTPGLAGDPAAIEAASEVALAALCWQRDEVGLAALDASTGNFRATSAKRGGDGGTPAALWDELERIAPRELLVPAGEGASAAPDASAVRGVANASAAAVAPAALSAVELAMLPAAAELAVLRQRARRAALMEVALHSYAPQAAKAAPHGFDPQGRGAAMCAAAALLAYVEDRQPAALRFAPRLRCYGLGDAMILDAATRAHLELFENGEDGSRRGTLIERLDATRTPLGARRLAHWVAYPLCDPQAIRRRQDAVEWLAARDRPRARLREALGLVRDLERLYARCARPGAEPRDLAALRASLESLPALRAAFGAEFGGAEGAAGLALPQPVPEAAELLRAALVDAPKPLPRGSRGAGETGYIRAGFRPELDAQRDSGRAGREWIAGLEARERERTGIPNLRVRFHPVHGYSLEVTKTNISRVPEDFERKQTLASVERYTTRALREMEAKVLESTERAAALERACFEEVRQQVLACAAEIRAAAAAVAELDALQSLAEVARADGWLRPVVDDSDVIEIGAGRHPVVEQLLRQQGHDFVPNDADLCCTGTRLLLVTGPNMAGKSTYLRQVAILVLLAQIGSFVPAGRVRIGVVDRVFTRVGASDRLARGESTFMVEMRETAEILSQASPRSLVILDEIGRGTSTYDGLSIAWAVAEYLHDTKGLGSRTLFATHHHELADLSRSKAGVRNAHFEARELQDDVVFLHKLVPGSARRSYGIQVARLAGLPSSVIARAREMLRRLEAGEFNAAAPISGAPPESPPEFLEQPGLFAADSTGREVLLELRNCDPDHITPIQALAMLARLCAKLAEADSQPAPEAGKETQ